MWRRWDPHIHAPGTLLNDGFAGPDVWNRYLERIESADPPVQVLGITDYYLLDSYEAVLAQRRQGRLPGVKLIFPNIEMRYGVGTVQAAAVNVHLVVSPDATDHVEQVRRFLRSLTFEYKGESFRCDRPDLIALGRTHDERVQTEGEALAIGVNQFKVSFDQFREEWRKSEWIRTNAFVAVAARTGDGTSGLAHEASLAGLRTEIERFARIIWSGVPSDRKFWLGHGAATLKELTDRYGGTKPCLHGSDAHTLESVANPALERYCWIKGDPSFESLRQVCIEPEDRVLIATEPPRGALPSQVIDSLSVDTGSWLTTPRIELNPGLVGIIGPKGSGKTALADFIASGAFALHGHLTDRSFAKRARPHLLDSTVELAWTSGDVSGAPLGSEPEDFEEPRIRYLSQQFVDNLCSAEGVSDELVREIERVVYSAHPPEQRMGTTSFRELLDVRTQRARMTRERNELLLAEIADDLNDQMQRRDAKPDFERRKTEKARLIAKDKADRTLLIAKGHEGHAKELELIVGAIENVRSTIDGHARRREALLGLRDEIEAANTEKNAVQQRLRRKYAEARLSDEEWSHFVIAYPAAILEALDAKVTGVVNEIARLTGPAKAEPPATIAGRPSVTSLLRKDLAANAHTLSLLEKEAARLRALVGIDDEHARRLRTLTDKIAHEEAELASLGRELDQAIAADGRIKELIQQRRDVYSALFDGLVEEERQLGELYQPLRAGLADEPGALGKLSFLVRRTVDLDGWADEGERLLDLRTIGPFRGHGALADHARALLLDAWRTGSSAEVAAAMSAFRDQFEEELRQHRPQDVTGSEERRSWNGRIAAWLYNTSHITVTYGVQYEGEDIERLSPGTRGIVLLLLYLALDRDDDRPLVIDQPEENLDPRSVYDELVPRFRRAKLRRQIIVVTHNANLIVNGDADQVIVATAGPHRPGQLPEISYNSGGLENDRVRTSVCDILEGGEEAFRDRAQRLRVRLPD